MRCLLLLALAACGFRVEGGAAGDDVGPTPDAIDPIDAPPDAYVAPDPRVIPGGGVGDAPIVNTVHVHVIDRLTRLPIADAAVDVDGVAGTTSATGLFTAAVTDDKVNVLATRAGYRGGYWVGVRGVNVTIALDPVPVPAPAFGTLSGTISGFAAITVGVNHVKAAVVAYSRDEAQLSQVNDISTPGNTNVCTTGSCAFTVRTRTGKVALFATLYDVDLRGPGDMDNVNTVIGFAYETGLTVAEGGTQNGVTLTMVPTASLTNAMIDFGTLPPGTTGAFGVGGIDLGEDGLVLLPEFPTPNNNRMIRAPMLSAIPGATGYYGAGLAGGPGFSSVVVRRDLATPALPLGTWPLPPMTVTATRTQATFTPVDDAGYHTIEIATAAQNPVPQLQIVILDDTTTVAFPSGVTLPAGAIRVTASAVSPAIDVTSFSLDAHAYVQTGVAARAVDVP